MPEVVILSESHSPLVDYAMSFARFDSSSNDIEASFSTLMSPRSLLPESWVPLEVGLVDLVSEDEGEDLEEDTSYEEDPSMDEEDPVTKPKFMEEDSSQDSSEDSC